VRGFKTNPSRITRAKSVEAAWLYNDQSRQAQIWLFGQQRASRANERTERASFVRRHVLSRRHRRLYYNFRSIFKLHCNQMCPIASIASIVHIMSMRWCLLMRTLIIMPLDMKGRVN